MLKEDKLALVETEEVGKVVFVVEIPSTMCPAGFDSLTEPVQPPINSEDDFSFACLQPIEVCTDL